MNMHTVGWKNLFSKFTHLFVCVLYGTCRVGGLGVIIILVPKVLEYIFVG